MFFLCVKSHGIPRFPGRGNRFSLVQSVPTGSGTHLEPYSLRSRTLSSRVKRLGREDYHLPQSSTEVKNEWRYTSTPIRFRGVHRDNSSFTSHIGTTVLSSTLLRRLDDIGIIIAL